VNEIETVGIFINTPAQYHFYKNIIYELNKLGIKTAIVYRDYGETKSLIKENNQNYFEYSSKRSSLVVKSTMIPLDIFRACHYLKHQNVDLVTGFGLYDCFSSSLLGVPCIVFNDSEPYINSSYSIQYKIFMPFTDIIVTPSFFNQDLGRKQIRVNSIKETAYLHPKYYSPDKSIFEFLNLSENEIYAILRFNSFDAGHDIGISGFDMKDKIELVRRIGSQMKIFISSEGKMGDSLSKFQIKIPKSRIHDAIAFASLVVTDTQTIATEAAILGTPVIRSNAFVGKYDMGIFNELEKRHLLFNFKDRKQAIDKAEEISNNYQKFKTEWINESKRFLEENICITDFMVDLMTRYSEYTKRL
jgi:uncharacterized protein